MGPEVATLLASRRSQSVSNPVDVPPLPRPSALSRSNTARLVRSLTTSAGVMPLRAKTPQGTTAGVETGTATGGAPTTLRSRPSLRRLKVQGTPQVAQQSAPQSLQSGQYGNATQGMTPLVMSAAPPPGKGGGCSSLILIVYLSATLRSFHEQTAELTLFV